MILPHQIAKTSEDSHCIALMQWCALNIKTYPQLKWFAHIPNGGARDLREGVKFKAMGVKRGFPDYILPLPIQTSWGHQFAGLFIEMKVGKNIASPEQKEYLAYLSEVGYCCHICYGWEEAKDRIIEYFNLIKG
jgi:hypothetical protein